MIFGPKFQFFFQLNKMRDEDDSGPDVASSYFLKENPCCTVSDIYTAVFHLEWPTRCEYIRVPTTGSLMGTRWKEAPLDNPMQLARVGHADVPTFSGPLGAGHMLCTRVHACGE